MMARPRHDASQEELSSFQPLVVSRLMLATLFVVASILGGAQQGPSYLWTGLFFLVTAFSLVRARRHSIARILSVGQIVADLVIITSLIAFTERGGGLFVFLYLMPIISAGLLFPRGGELLVAALSGMVYGGLTVATYIWPTLGERPGSAAQGAYSACITLVVFIAIGVLVRQLIEHMRRDGRELNRLRSLHDAILSNMNTGLVTTDAENHVIYANPAAEATLGRPSSDIVGRHIGAFFAHRSADAPLVPFDPPAERVARDRREDTELVGLTETGDQVPIGYNLSLIPGERPEHHAGKVMLFTDLTKVKQLERRLRQADRLRAVGELAASIAHEIRNPLASIAGSIEMLTESDAIGDGEQRLLRIIMKESDRLNHIIEEFLAYARERTPQLAPHDIHTIVEEVVTLFRNNAAATRGIQLELDAPDELPRVLADGEQIKQVFFNLLRNATDAMPSGGTIRVQIEACEPEAADHEPAPLCVRVSDTGCGIPPEALDHVFEPFFSTKRGGLGIGLALAEKIMRGHNGTISVESVSGNGTTFSITLPRVTAAAAGFDAPARGNR